METLREQILSLGWRQGSVIAGGDGGLPEDVRVSPHDAFLILSQTCDLVNDSLDKEPVVELLPLVRVDKTNSSLLNGRNPRRIQFEMTLPEGLHIVEAFAPATLSLPRRSLLGIRPSEHWSVGAPVLKSLLAWRAARYLRTAFPDTFENRLKAVFKEFKGQVEKINEHLHSLFIRVEPFEELPDGDPHEIDLLLVIHRRAHDNTETRSHLVEAGDQIKRLINASDHLVCAGCQVRAPHEISLEEVEGYIRWDRYDYLSFGEDD